MRWLLRRLNIHPNAYYNYLLKTKAEYYDSREEIFREIKNIYHEYDGVLGHRAMRVFLARKGIKLSKTTVHKYMNRCLKLKSVCRRKKPSYKKGNPHKIFPNLLEQNFHAESLTRSGVQTSLISVFQMALSDSTAPSLIYMTEAS